MVRLTRLKIDRFRNVKPGTDLSFGPTFNVLLGKNATGKTTLLDLVAAVTNDDLSGYAEEDAGFDLTWWIEQGENQLERRAVRTPAPSSALLEHVREEKEFDDTWTMVLRTAGDEVVQLAGTGTHGSLKPRDEPAVPFEVRAGLARDLSGLRVLFAAYDKVVTVGDEVAPSRAEAPVVIGVRAAARMVSLAFHGVGRFDEALAAMIAITRSPFTLSGGGSELARWMPDDFRTVLLASTSPDAPVIPFDLLGSLAKIPALLGFSAAELRPRMLQRSQDGERVTRTYQGFDCLFRRADGSKVSHEFLSFGQKRLFSFLWYLAVREELPVVADELFNGLHHAWIQICLDRLYERQSFLATQHPYLLDHVPIESADGVRKSFIRCTLEPGPDGREQMAWRNFTEDEAERFFIAYETGIPQVSEVLRTEGLW